MTETERLEADCQECLKDHRLANEAGDKAGEAIAWSRYLRSIQLLVRAQMEESDEDLSYSDEW